jgi:Tfp pilus assembly protein PilN
MRAVNLLPKEIVREGRELPRGLHMVGAAAVPVLAIAFVVIGWRGQHSALAVKQTELTVLRAQIPKPQPITKPVLDTTPLIAVRTARRAALDDVLIKRVEWDKALRDLSRVLPANVWLTALSASAPVRTDSTTLPVAPAPGAPPVTSFTITGYTYAEKDVATLLQRLQLLPTLTAVTLSAATASQVDEKPLIQFNITASVVSEVPIAPVPVPVPAPVVQQ